MELLPTRCEYSTLWESLHSFQREDVCKKGREELQAMFPEGVLMFLLEDVIRNQKCGVIKSPLCVSPDQAALRRIC